MRNSRSASWFNGEPSVLLVINKQANSNVIETVDRIYELLPELKRWIPAGIDITVLSDRTQTIRASIQDMQLTLLATIALVMLVVFVFLRRAAATIAAGVTVPLSLAGTCAMMWVAGFSIDNLSLMALAVSVGFVVDDAIVMIENCFRNLEKGMSPFRAAIEGAQQIGFTVLAISISLVAAFIPLLFMTGVVGRIFREFSVTLAFAIAVSTAVSLTLTPMICAHFVRTPPSPDATWLDRLVERVLGVMVRAYARSLAVVLDHRALTLLVMAATLAVTAMLYVRTPKGYFPQDDTGLIWGGTQASTEVSFQAMYDLQQKADAIVRADPAVANVGSSIGTSGYSSSVNRGSLFISLKPLSERGGLTAQAVANRLAAEDRRYPGTARLLLSDAGRAGRRPLQQFLLPVHALGRRLSGAVCAGRRACSPRSSRCRDWSMSPPTASRAGCRSTCRSTGSRPRAWACACRTSPMRSTTPMRSARSRRSTPSATSIASFSRSIRNISATRPISPAST